MAYNTQILTSVVGRRLGLQFMSTDVSGAVARKEFLVGPNDFRVGVTTAETTAASPGVTAEGLSVLFGTSVASSAVYVLDPPIPGVRKVLHFGTTADKLYIRTKNAEVIRSSGISTSATFTTITSSAGGTVELMGLSTAVWLAPNCPSTLSGISFAATT